MTILMIKFIIIVSVRKPAPSARTSETCGLREGRSDPARVSASGERRRQPAILMKIWRLQTGKTDRVLQPAVDRRGFRTDTN
jgi:hypothetical protein